MEGKVCLVTGASSGIGKALCVELARRGAVVVVSARDAAKSEAAAAEVRAAAGGRARVEALACDVSSVAATKRAAAALKARHPALHLLVNNAAVFHKDRRTSPDGLELGYAVNTLAPFVLATELLDALRAGAPSRIVNMTMATDRPLDFDDLQAERAYRPLDVLKSTKAGHLYLTRELARRTAGTGVTVLSVDPGLTRSKLPTEAPLWLRLVFRLFGKAPEAGARVPLGVCCDEAWTARSGTFVSDKGVATPMPVFVDDDASARLWAINERLALTPPRPAA